MFTGMKKNLVMRIYLHKDYLHEYIYLEEKHYLDEQIYLDKYYLQKCLLEKTLLG